MIIAKNAEARCVIEPDVAEESLAGYVHLLRAELDARLGAFEKARVELAAAEAAKPPPSAAEILDTRLKIHLGAREYDAALKAVATGAVDASARPALRVRVRLAERAGTADIVRKNAAETALFKDLATVRDSARGDARAALIAVARSLREPSASQDPLAWDLLAAGAILIGDAERAGNLEQKAASRAEVLKNLTLATELLLRAGAFFYQAEKFADADRILTRIVENPEAGQLPGRG